MKLKWKLILLFSCVSLAITVTVGALLYYQLHKDHVLSVQTDTLEQLRHIAFSLNIFIDDVENDVRTLTQIEAVRSKNDGDFTNFTQAGDGQQGIELAERENPDLILLDIQLPEVDGYAVARKIKTIHALAGIPIVAVTSYAMMGDRKKAMAAGCSGYIEKPINPETFTEQIREFLPGTPQGKKVIS